MKRITYIYFILIGLVSINCRTIVPERDSVAPTFLFHIRGTTLNEEIRETFDFDNSVLYLKRGDAYNALFSANDAGGLQFIRWRLAGNPIFQVTNFFADPCIIRSISNGELEILCNGDRDDPTTGLFTSVDFIANGATTSTVEERDVYFSTYDFKGNETSKILTIRITNEGPRVGPR